MKEGLVSEAGFGRYAAASALKNVGRKTYEILIEKINGGLGWSHTSIMTREI